MKNIALITNSFANLKDNLIDNGFTVDIYALNSLQNQQQVIKNKNYQQILFELTPESIKHYNTISNKPGQAIAIAKDGNPPAFKDLLQNGISKFITQKNFDCIIPLLVDPVQGIKSRGNIVLFEEKDILKNLLSDIILNFNYKPVHIHSNKDLYNTAAIPETELIIINLSNSNLKINELIHEAYNDSRLRQIPVIIYKDMDEGLFIHELIAGLNRLTKYILSINETLHYLVKMLYKNNLIPLISKLNAAAHAQCNHFYAEKSLKQIVNQHYSDIFKNNVGKHIDPCEVKEVNAYIARVSTLYNSYNWLLDKSQKTADFTYESGV